jgi:hypothetical protein
MLLLLVFSADLKAAMGGVQGDDAWFEVFLNGEKIGYEHHVLTKTLFRGKTCYRYQEISRGRIKINDRVSVSETTSTSYFSPDMTPIYQKSVAKEKEQVIITEIIITRTEVIIRKKLGATRTEKKIPFRPGYTFSANGPLLKFKGLDAGRHYTLRAIYEEKSSIEEEKVEVQGHDSIMIDGRARDCVLVKISSSALPGIPVYTWVDTGGRLFKMKTVAIESIRTTKEKALMEKEVGSYSNRIATKELLPPDERLAALQIRMNIDEKNPGNLLESNDYQDIRIERGSIVLSLKAVKAEGNSPSSAVLTAKEREKYCAPTVLIESGDPGIIKKALEITHRYDDRLSQVKMLCAWIYYTLKKEESDVSSRSARETLKSESGDCTEHAVLFCAFARALGIPSREVCGLVFTGDSFGYHAWAEAWCGSWVPVDATVNRVGVPACYMELGNDAEGRPTLESTAKLVKMLNKTSFEIQSAQIGDKIYRLDDPASFLEIDDLRCHHVIWGLSAEKPRDWSFRFDDCRRIFIENKSGASVSIYPLFSATGNGPELMEREVNHELGKNGEVFTFLKPQYRSMKDYALYEVPFVGPGGAKKGSAIIAVHSDKAFVVILHAPGEHFDADYQAFEKILESLQF